MLSFHHIVIPTFQRPLLYPLAAPLPLSLLLLLSLLLPLLQLLSLPLTLLVVVPAVLKQATKEWDLSPTELFHHPHNLLLLTQPPPMMLLTLLLSSLPLSSVELRAIIVVLVKANPPQINRSLSSHSWEVSHPVS